MLKRLHHQYPLLQLFMGLIIGIGFGFFLQKGAVTRYDVIIGQLLLADFTVLKVMLTAVITGMIGIYAMRALGWVQLHPKPGAVGTSVLGGLVFGVGFAVLGYCPGTVAGAVGQGSLDALWGGVVGLVIGTWLYAAAYPRMKSLSKLGSFGSVTLPELVKVSAWQIVIPACIVLTVLLILVERTGL
jgi:hypothetical protein